MKRSQHLLPSFPKYLRCNESEKVIILNGHLFSLTIDVYTVILKSLNIKESEVVLMFVKRIVTANEYSMTTSVYAH